MARQRLINCDFLSVSGFLSNLSNKAKLLYFMFLVNADDMGFVGNAQSLADTLDLCQENFDNVLFQIKFSDTLKELVDKHLTYEFSDKVGNKTYLIRHWFLHNKQQKFLTTNFVSYLAQVELVNNEYVFKNHQKENPYKGKEIKENQTKLNQTNIEIKNKEMVKDDNWEENWDNMLKELEEQGEQNEKH